MKQYYESEVLFQLMERDGLNIPSSVPPYEAEIKAYLINQVKQAYPKLTDYEAEWLLYNYTKHLPAEFPVSSVSDVTDATFENVVPFAYQSAILKGQTLVNLSGTYTNKFPQGNTDGNIPITSTANNNKRSYVANVLPNKEYTIIKFGESNRFNVISYNNLQDSTTAIQLHISNNDELPKKIKITTKSNSELIYIYFQTSDNIDVLPKFIIIEGDYTNVDIPYFEGMQSVKMPVLTTTGKNLFNPKLLKNTETESVLRFEDDGSVTLNGPLNSLTWFYLDLPKGTYQASSFNDTLNAFHVFWTDTDGFFETRNYFTLNEDTRIKGYIKKGNYDNYNIKLQLETGTQKTSYEPYKSNILTVNEEVELRGIGDVQDTLDCLTGEVTERIGEIVLDGTQSNVGYRSEYSNDDYYCFMYDITKNGYKKASSSPIGISCPIPFQQNKMFGWGTAKEFVLIDSNTLLVKLLKSKLNNDNSISSLNTYLASNPITINYPLETESIKTVDLTTVNEKGETTHFMPLEGTMHLTTSSETINPLFSGEIPVEAVTQNLASFIDLEMRNNNE